MDKRIFSILLAWLTFIAFKQILAYFSLERLWCCAMIGGSRTAPCVAEKTNLPGFGPSSFVSLSQPVRQVYFQTGKGLAALPASKLNALKPRLPIRWYQWPRPSGLSCRHLHAAIQQPFCYFQQYKFFSLWCDRDTPAFFGKGDQLRCLGNWPPYTLPRGQH